MVFWRASTQGGISLVETLVSLTVGLAVVSAAFNLYTSNRTVFKQVEGLARLQESARVASALLAADIRQAGGSLCRNGLPTTNLIKSSKWWYQPVLGIQGFASSPASDPRADASSYPRKAGDSFTVWSGNADIATSVVGAVNRSYASDTLSTGAGSFELKLNSNSGFDPSDVVVICDFHFATVAQFATATPFRITANKPDDPDPGNCGPFFKASGASATPLPSCVVNNAAYKASMPNSIANDYTWTTGSMVGKLMAHHWYIGQKTNPASGSRNNLALRRLTNGISDEMVENVSNMQISYLVGDANGYPASTNYVTSVADWTKVIAVRIELTLTSPEAIAVGAGAAASAASYTIPINVAIRSRLPGRVASQ